MSVPVAAFCDKAADIVRSEGGVAMNWPLWITIAGGIGMVGVAALWLNSQQHKRQIERLIHHARPLRLVRADDLTVQQFMANAHRSAAPYFGHRLIDAGEIEELRPLARELAGFVMQWRVAFPNYAEKEHLAFGLIAWAKEKFEAEVSLGEVTDVNIVEIGRVFPIILLSGPSSSLVVAAALTLIYDAASPAQRP